MPRAYLSASGLTAGEIADRFSMSKPAVSQHLSILETAGLIRREKQGQFVHYSLFGQYAQWLRAGGLPGQPADQEGKPGARPRQRIALSIGADPVPA